MRENENEKFLVGFFSRKNDDENFFDKYSENKKMIKIFPVNFPREDEKENLLGQFFERK